MKTAIIEIGIFNLKSSMLVAFTLLCIVIAVPVQADTQFYFLRHVELDMKNPDRLLISNEHERDSSLIKYIKTKNITHIYTTHTNRARDTVIPLAKEHGLKILQFPKPGLTDRRKRDNE